MKYILQVFSGPWNTAYYQPEEIIRTIRGIASRIPVEKVIIGWSTDDGFVQFIAEKVDIEYVTSKISKLR